MPTSQWQVDTAVAHEDVYAAVAIHPNEVRERRLTMHGTASRELAAHPKVVAVGETGLDHFRTGEDGWKAQEESFRRHIAIAKSTGKALVIHDRDAHDDVLRVLAERGCAGSRRLPLLQRRRGRSRVAARTRLRDVVRRQHDVRQRGDLREAVAVAPLELLLVETDAPFLTPMPYRGRPNAPYLVPLTVRAIADGRRALERRRDRGGCDGECGPGFRLVARKKRTDLSTAATAVTYLDCGSGRSVVRFVERLYDGRAGFRPGGPTLGDVCAASLYRLVAYAATIAALSTGVTAFAAMDKTVRLDVDGHTIAVRTFAGDVSGVLRKAHVQLQAHDAVAPDLSAPVRDGSRVVVRHGRLLTLHRRWPAAAGLGTALSVDDALDQLGLRADGEWMSVSRSLAIPRQGLSLVAAAAAARHGARRRQAADDAARPRRTSATLLADLHVPSARWTTSACP